MFKVFVTREIPQEGLDLLRKNPDIELTVSPHDRVLSRAELLEGVGGVDALLCLLTDKIDGEVMDAAGSGLKIISNYAVGFNNIDIEEAKKRGIAVTNTPGVLTEAVAEHTFALMLAVAKRVVEADRFTRAGKYEGWAPMLLLGTELQGKTLGVVGLGRIGSRVVEMAVNGMGMKAVYHDINRNEEFEKQFGARFAELEDLLKSCDFISIHVPLLPSTKHLINADRLRIMKSTAYLINTSRGPVIDEKALVESLKNGVIRGAALDVYEDEPELAPGLSDLENVVLTPHIASATEEARGAMARLAAQAIIDVKDGKNPEFRV